MYSAIYLSEIYGIFIYKLFKMSPSLIQHIIYVVALIMLSTFDSHMV